MFFMHKVGTKSFFKHRIEELATKLSRKQLTKRTTSEAIRHIFQKIWLLLVECFCPGRIAKKLQNKVTHLSKKFIEDSFKADVNNFNRDEPQLQEYLKEWKEQMLRQRTLLEESFANLNTKSIKDYGFISALVKQVEAYQKLQALESRELALSFYNFVDEKTRGLCQAAKNEINESKKEHVDNCKFNASKVVVRASLDALYSSITQKFTDLEQQDEQWEVSKEFVDENFMSVIDRIEKAKQLSKNLYFTHSLAELEKRMAIAEAGFTEWNKSGIEKNLSFEKQCEELIGNNQKFISLSEEIERIDLALKAWIRRSELDPQHTDELLKNLEIKIKQWQEKLKGFSGTIEIKQHYLDKMWKLENWMEIAKKKFAECVDCQRVNSDQREKLEDLQSRCAVITSYIEATKADLSLWMRTVKIQPKLVEEFTENMLLKTGDWKGLLEEFSKDIEIKLNFIEKVTPVEEQVQTASTWFDSLKKIQPVVSPQESQRDIESFLNLCDELLKKLDILKSNLSEWIQSLKRSTLKQILNAYINNLPIQKVRDFAEEMEVIKESLDAAVAFDKDDQYVLEIVSQGYEHVKVDQDGHCLFAACLAGLKEIKMDDLELQQLSPLEFRQKVYSYMQEHKERYDLNVQMRLQTDMKDLEQKSDDEFAAMLERLAPKFHMPFIKMRKMAIDYMLKHHQAYATLKLNNIHEDLDQKNDQDFANLLLNLPSDVQAAATDLRKNCLKVKRWLQNEAFDIYISSMAKCDKFAEETEMLAIHEMMQVPIRVFSNLYELSQDIGDYPADRQEAIHIIRPKATPHFDYMRVV